MKYTEPFSILYEDDAILGVNKAAGISVLADRWDDSRERLDELLNSYFAHEAQDAAAAVPPRPPRIPHPHRVFVVHRIDRETSGLVLFAKTQGVRRSLSMAFESRSVQKRYIAVVHGRPSWTETDCDLPLRPDGDREHRTVIDKYKGKNARTHFKVLGSVSHYTVLEALLETGRTHQIRVHLASLGHSIVCDPLYGSGAPVKLSSFKRSWRGDPLDERPLLSRLGLHAQKVVLPDELELTAPLPKDLSALFKQFEKVLGTSLDFQ